MCTHTHLPEQPYVFVSSRDESDKDKVKNLLINQIKHSLTYYEETVPSSDADRLYFLKQHTLVSELNFNEKDESYEIKGYKKI
mgnify:FL=1